MTPVCIDRIAAANPLNNVHAAFLDCASGMLNDQRASSALRHMA
jgi:hypothetical protein